MESYTIWPFASGFSPWASRLKSCYVSYLRLSRNLGSVGMTLDGFEGLERLSESAEASFCSGKHSLSSNSDVPWLCPGWWPLGPRHDDPSVVLSPAHGPCHLLSSSAPHRNGLPLCEFSVILPVAVWVGSTDLRENESLGNQGEDK